MKARKLKNKLQELLSIFGDFEVVIEVSRFNAEELFKIKDIDAESVNFPDEIYLSEDSDMTLKDFDESDILEKYDDSDYGVIKCLKLKTGSRIAIDG